MEKEYIKPKIFICDPIAKIGIDMLKEYCIVDIKSGMTETQLAKVIIPYDVAIVRSSTKS
jgi:D-3-phosphoglycerate dehydrogenase / 2-oxoglutarate reductase